MRGSVGSPSVGAFWEKRGEGKKRGGLKKKRGKKMGLCVGTKGGQGQCRKEPSWVFMGKKYIEPRTGPWEIKKMGGFGRGLGLFWLEEGC